MDGFSVQLKECINSKYLNYVYVAFQLQLKCYIYNGGLG
jgi:hypothetical protein